MLLYFGLSLNPSSHAVLMLFFFAEVAAALYVTWAFGKHGAARMVAMLLAVTVLLPIIVNLLRGAYRFDLTAGPAVVLSFALVAILAAAQVLCLGILLTTKADRAASA
jgi:hypothetical protein